ncbi:MAG TPA: helix-turn-helix transcriptional regulator [Rugosimonospora sp.]|nr:helix-turn-helix transcriptional regulator [Rugosimonospora sp.]
MFQRRRLRMELRKAREAANLTQREVAPSMDWSLSKLIRIETGAVGISTSDLKVLLQLYHVDPGRIDELVEAARAAREPAWWSPYKDVASQETLTFIGYESAASVIRNFEPIVIPGLLQTEEYARATLAEMVPTTAPADPQILTRVDSLVELRMERQDRLTRREDPPKIFFAIDESVIHRWVGGPNIMRRQLRRVREVLDQPEFTIWIVPYQVGLYQRQRIAYQLLEFPSDDDDDVLYLESVQGEDIVRDDFQEAAVFLEAFWRIEQIALKNEAAIGLIERALSDIDSGVSDAATTGTPGRAPSDAKNSAPQRPPRRGRAQAGEDPAA